MAMFPCDLDGQRYAGAQRTIYPALVSGASSYRRRLRCCPGHFAALVKRVELHCTDAQLDFLEDSSDACALCGDAVPDTDWRFYVTAYDHGTERRDYYGPCHDACVADLADMFKLPAS